MAENIIFYGPPGTGKTFFMQKMMSDYIDYNIDDETIRHTYMHHSEKWLLIALVLGSLSERQPPALLVEKKML